MVKYNLRYAESAFEFTYPIECPFIYIMHETFHIPIKVLSSGNKAHDL